MRTSPLLAAALTASACVPITQEQPDAQLGIAGMCNAVPVQRLIGLKPSKEVGEQALKLSGTAQLRWIGPGDPVTMDYSTDRLNIETDGRRIVRIYCG